MSGFHTAAIIAKPDPLIGDLVKQLIGVITSAGLTPVLAQSWEGDLPGCSCRRLPDAELAQECDVCVTLGGDGTMLGAARLLARSGVPIIGVNAGRLGFITDISIGDMPRMLPAMLQGKYVSDSRGVLEGTLYHHEKEVCRHLAVNDISVAHGRALGMIQYTVYVDQQQMAVQRADGILVSTATGSTAYALAAGGPIMHPRVHSMLLVPVAPHTLSNRPIVLYSRSTIDIELNESRSAVVGFDTQLIYDMYEGDVMRVKTIADAYSMLHPVGYNQFDLLRRKLRWNYLPKAEQPVHHPLPPQPSSID